MCIPIQKFRVMAKLAARRNQTPRSRTGYEIWKALVDQGVFPPKRPAVYRCLDEFEERDWATVEADPACDDRLGRRCFNLTKDGEKVFRARCPEMQKLATVLLQAIDSGLDALGD